MSFTPRDRLKPPSMVATVPQTNSQIDLSVGASEKNREKSELVESYSIKPKINRSIPPAKMARERALFIVSSLSRCYTSKISPIER